MKHGWADYASKMQLTASEAANIIEGSDSIPLTGQKFAQLTYQVNTVPVTISGGVSIGAVEIKDGAGNLVDVSVGGDMHVIDDTVAAGIAKLSGVMENLKPLSYSHLFRIDGFYSYHMMALPSSGTISSGDPVWQVSRIYTDVSGNSDMMFADGNDKFDNVAADYLSLAYGL